MDIFFLCSIIVYAVTVVLISPLSPSSTWPAPDCHGQSPYRGPRPWVLHIRYLTNPFTLFETVPPPSSPLTAVSLIQTYVPTLTLSNVTYDAFSFMS